MPQRYVATYVYTERVRGEDREFVHETIIEAAGDAAAFHRALEHFDLLERESGVGWKRVLKSCSVAVARGGAAAKGGRRVYRDRESET